MKDNAFVYGAVVSAEDRHKIASNCPEADRRLQWRDNPTLYTHSDDVSLVFVDLDDPRFTKSEFLLSLATGGKDVTVIGKTEHPRLEDTIHFSKLGISEVLNSGQCFSRLTEFARQPVTGQKTESENQAVSKYSTDALVGVSPQIVEIRKMVGLLAEVDFPSALILGETGTGKGLVAKILHHSGMRSRYNMVEVNCSAIPDELFESELFGHVEGAFTDARTEKMGLFEYAREGTLFLDEVGNLSDSAQAKLLKVLEDKRLRKIGAIEEETINVRVVAATNLDLRESVEAGKIRSDLYYRLNLLTIEIPPLRERPDDIPPVVEHYMSFYSTLYGKPSLTICPEAIDKMKQYHWPGNIRELCNVIERAVLLARSEIIPVEDISKALEKGRLSLADRQQLTIDIPPYGISLGEIEQKVVTHVLNLCQWNKSEAAKFLGISRPRLRRIMEKVKLEQDRRNQ